MKRFAFALCLLLPIAAIAGQPAEPEVRDVWARDTIGGTANGAVYMTITSQILDRLVAASTPVADRTDLMTMKGGSGAMEMTYLKGIDLPANTKVSLNPAGFHVWLTGLKQPLRAGQTFSLTLTFEKAGRRTVTVSIIKPNATPPMSGMRM